LSVRRKGKRAINENKITKSGCAKSVSIIKDQIT
jgi:hypothetical protein